MLRENFLSFLYPKSGDVLEITFLTIIGGLFLLGIILSIHLRIKWIKILNSGKKSNVFTRGRINIPCEDIDNASDLEQIFGGSSERFVSILPGMFLVLGILGTFIGLMLALGNLEGDIGASTEARNEVITAIGTQFKTSIWGIAANLVFSIFSNLFLSYKRFQSEAIYIANERLKGKNRYEKSKFENLVSSLEQHTKNLVSNSSYRNNLLEESNKLAKQIITTNQSVSTNTLGVKTAIVKFQEATESLLSGLKTTTDNFVETSGKFSTTVDRFDSNTTVVLDSIKLVIDKLESVMQTFSNDTKKIFTDPQTGMQAILTSLKNDLVESLQKIKESLEKEISKMNDTVENLADQSDQLKEAQIEVTERMEQQEKHNAHLVRNVRESQAFLKQFKDEILGQEGELYNSLNRAISQIYSPDVESNSHLIGLISKELAHIKAELNNKVRNEDLLNKINGIMLLMKNLPTKELIETHLVQLNSKEESNGIQEDGKSE